MRRLILIITAICGVLYAITSVANAQMAVPPVPTYGYVVDQTKTLSDDEISQLNGIIDDYKNRTSVQLAVLMIPTITDDYLENYSLNVARSWGIGEAGKNNGALLLVVKNDRKLRIEVGTGLEGDLTDLRAGRIIRERITPHFKNGDFYTGIYSGVLGMTLAIGDSPDPLLATEQDSSGFWSNTQEIVTAIFYFGFFGISWLGAILGRSERWWPGGVIGGTTGSGMGYFLSSGSAWVAVVSGASLLIVGVLFDYLVSHNYKSAISSGNRPSWWAGGTKIGGGGSSGGFGGGGFSGGGSSGSW